MKSVIDLAEQVKDYAAAGKTIAPVENGTTAVGSYAIGEKFIREGVLYKAKTSITVGDTLTLNTNYELEDNVVTQISDVKQALSDEVETRATLGAHNLLKLDLGEIKSLNTDGTWSGNAYTLNGVTFTVNSDYTISTNGTASANTTFYLYRYSTWTKLPLRFLSGCPSGGGMDKYILRLVRGGAFSKNDTGEGVLLDQDDIASPVDVTMVVVSGNNVSGLTFKPMIRLATDSDATYQPYSKSNTELTQDDIGLTANAFANGAVNLLENKATSTTKNGITMVVNADGTLTFTSDGTTRTGNTDFDIAPLADGFPATDGVTYHLSGCPIGGSDNNTFAVLVGGYGKFDIGNGVDFTASSTTGIPIRIYVRIYKDYTFSSSLTFKPMITVADMPNSDYAHYVQYAKSNRQLTDEYIGESIGNISSILGTNISTTSYDSLIERKNGVVYMNLNLINSVALSSGDVVLTLPTGFRPKGTIRAVSYNNARFVINANGSVYSTGDSVPANSPIIINITYPV